MFSMGSLSRPENPFHDETDCIRCNQLQLIFVQGAVIGRGKTVQYAKDWGRAEERCFLLAGGRNEPYRSPRQVHRKRVKEKGAPK